MFRLQDKDALVIGLGLSGAAASRLLVARGARVTAMDNSDTPELRREAEELRDLGVRVELDRKSTRLNSSHTDISRMPSSA